MKKWWQKVENAKTAFPPSLITLEWWWKLCMKGPKCDDSFSATMLMWHVWNTFGNEVNLILFCIFVFNIHKMQMHRFIRDLLFIFKPSLNKFDEFLLNYRRKFHVSISNAVVPNTTQSSNHNVTPWETFDLLLHRYCFHHPIAHIFTFKENSTPTLNSRSKCRQLYKFIQIMMLNMRVGLLPLGTRLSSR